MTAPPIPAQSIQVFCPDCEQMVAVVARRASIWTALSNHTCTTARGTAPQAVDAKAVRAWAAANGVDCPSSGIVPKRVVDAWRAAQ